MIVPATPKPQQIDYPESDGQPMAENTRQFRYIVTIKEGLDAQYRNEPNVFVAGDLFWYPVEGNNAIRVAPDILVAFGRPKGDRGSYLQWEENGIAPQVVMEILSPGNRGSEMVRKWRFYERHRVEEYYIYDPDTGDLSGWLRHENELREVPHMEGWVSPRLQVRFVLNGTELELYGPDGRRFLTYLELQEQWEHERREKEQAQKSADEARSEANRALGEANRAKENAERAQRRAERLAAQLRTLGIEPENGNGKSE
jgi:Uma2 family endonuclease